MHVFHSKLIGSFHSSFDFSVTQSIPTSNEQVMKTIELLILLLHVNKLCVDLRV